MEDRAGSATKLPCLDCFAARQRVVPDSAFKGGLFGSAWQPYGSVMSYSGRELRYPVKCSLW